MKRHLLLGVVLPALLLGGCASQAPMRQPPVAQVIDTQASAGPLAFADGRVFMLWFSFQPQGGQAWFFAEGSLNGAVITFADVLRPVGTRFGPDFVPADVRFERWGSARIELQVNGQIQLDYAADDSNWGAGTLHWQRLTQPLLP